MGVMKMGNIVPRAGPKPTSLAFRASVLPLHHVGSLMSPLSPRLPVYTAHCLRGWLVFGNFTFWQHLRSYINGYPTCDTAHLC